MTAAVAQTPPSAPQVALPPVTQQMPSLMDQEVQDWLKRGNFDRALARCDLEIRSAALVSEPGKLAPSYACLGEAHFGRKEYAEAVEAFSRSIEDLEASAGVFDPRLAGALDGLGKSLMALGKYDEASAVLSQAKDITHRNHGIYNLVQTPIVNRLTRVHYDRGEYSKANREQKFLLRANEETYGEAPQLLPALRRMGRWQEKIGRSDLARNTYRRAMGIMQRAYGSDDLRMIGPLRDYANSYLNTPRGYNRVMSGAGANALREVIRIYEAQTYSDAADVAEAWGQLGDWYVIGGRRRQANDAYAQAGQLLLEAGGGDSDQFSWPVEIEYEDVPIGIRNSRIAEFKPGIAVLEFEFTVTSSGRVSDLTVIRDDLDYPRFAIEVGQRVKAARYRPRIIDGSPVDTRGVRKTIRYDLARRLVKTRQYNAEEEAAPESAEQEQSAPEAPGEPIDEVPIEERSIE